MGKIILPGFFPEPDLLDDLARAAGAFLYVDPTYPLAPWAAGVPGTTVRNLAALQAPADATITTANNLGANGSVARSSKGGLHIAPSASAPAGATYQLLMSQAAANQVYADREHVFYLGASLRYTRAPGSATAVRQVARLGQNSNNVIVSLREGNSGTSVYGEPAGNATSANTPGLVRVSVAARGAAGLASILPWFFSVGQLTATGVAPSAVILYDLIVGDLSRSGDTFARVDGLHAAKHAAMHGAGGRYAGDTWTAP